MAIFSELKIADFPGLCVASLRTPVQSGYLVKRSRLISEILFPWDAILYRYDSTHCQICKVNPLMLFTEHNVPIKVHIDIIWVKYYDIIS